MQVQLPDGGFRRSKAASEETARWLKLRKCQAMIQEGIKSGDQEEERQQDSERKPLRFLARRSGVSSPGVVPEPTN